MHCKPTRRVGLCCFMTPSLSKDIQCHVWSYFSKLANNQIRHQATHRVDCQPGDSYGHTKSSSGVCVGMYVLTYSLYRPEGGLKFWVCPSSVNIISSVDQFLLSMQGTFIFINYSFDRSPTMLNKMTSNQPTRFCTQSFIWYHKQVCYTF